MKKGMPEPHAFLEAARRARAAAALEAQARRPNSSADGDASKVESSKAAGSEGGQGGPGGPSRTFERVASGRLAHLLGVDHASRAKVGGQSMLHLHASMQCSAPAANEANKPALRPHRRCP